MYGIFLNIRELYHGKIWHYNKCFQAQMVEYKKTVFYVEDIVQFQHPHFGVTYGKIVRFFQLVSCVIMFILYLL